MNIALHPYRHYNPSSLRKSSTKSPCLLSPQIPNSRLPNLHLRLEYPTVKSTDYMKYTMDLHLTKPCTIALCHCIQN